MSWMYFLVILTAFTGCKQPPPPTIPSDNLSVLYSKPLIDKSLVEDFLYNLDLYLRSCASGMRGLGSDRDPLNIGSEFLETIKSDTVFMGEKLMSSAQKSQDMEIVEDLFSAVLKTTAFLLRESIKARRANMFPRGWLSQSMPSRLSVLIISVRLFRKHHADPQTLKDIEAILILPGVATFDRIFNSDPLMIAKHTLLLCDAAASSSPKDDWKCLKDVWTLLMGLDYVRICTSKICASEHFRFLLSRVGPSLTKAAATPQSAESQQLYQSIFQAFVHELNAERPASKIGSILFTELSTITL
jgi:hypothetical protein